MWSRKSKTEIDNDGSAKLESWSSVLGPRIASGELSKWQNLPLFSYGFGSIHLYKVLVEGVSKLVISCPYPCSSKPECPCGS